MDKTIRELADEYGMSKQAMRYHIKKVPNRCINLYTKNGVKIFTVNPEGQEILRDLLVKRPEKEVENFTGKKVENFYTQEELQDELNALKKLVEILEKENELKQQTIDRLEKRNEEEHKQLMELTSKVGTTLQSLTQGQLADKLIEGKKLIDESAEKAPEKRRWFWRK